MNKTHYLKSLIWAYNYHHYHRQRKSLSLKESLYVVTTEFPPQMVYLQLHVRGILFIRHVTPTSRMTPTSVGGMYPNFTVPPLFKIKKLVLTLGTIDSSRFDSELTMAKR